MNTGLSFQTRQVIQIMYTQCVASGGNFVK